MKTNDLNHYPRFIFNCSDGRGLSTADLDFLKGFSKDDQMTNISSFNIDDIISIKWADLEEHLEYKVSKIEIKEIMYNTDERILGMNEFDVNPVFGKDKYWLMGLYVFLELIDQ
ncbi:MAG: hypothetical protein ACOH2A_02130 [Sphingobacteriaceae bacterium]